MVLALLLPGGAGAQAVGGPECLNNYPTIRGSGAITGTPGRDVILGSRGRDIIRGGGEADIICGAGGPDRIVGGAERDALSGGTGRDVVVGDGATWTDKRAVGGEGDTLYAGRGADVLIGDSFSRGGVATNRGGPDYLVGNGGRRPVEFARGDILIGGSATRTGRVVGRDSRDYLRGLGGPDLIIGDNANLRFFPHPVGRGSRDTIYGGSGPDDLIGGDGKDLCAGRGGRDSFLRCEAEPPICPRGAFDGLRPGRLIGLALERARRIARRHDGCEIRVLYRDGRYLGQTDDLKYNRINVAVRDERITRILGVF